MSHTETEASRPKSLTKGLVAGLIGGLVGALAKSLVERVFPPNELPPPDAATEAINWGFGAVTGAAYGALAEYYPSATAKQGASFGLALEALTTESALPAIGLAPQPEELTTRERTSEMTSHVVYGITTETVRGIVRKLI